MAYDIFEPRIFPLFIYYIFLTSVSIIIALKMFLKWNERKTPPTLKLTIVYVFLTLALLFLVIGMAEAVITGFFKEIYRLTFPLAYCMVVVADIILYDFSVSITRKGQKLLVPLIIIGSAIIILVLLPWNWWGHPSVDYEGQLNIRLYTSLSFVAYSIFVYLGIATITFKVKKQAKDKIVRFGLSFLFYSVICMILFFVFVMLDNVLIVLFNHPGYSEFVYIAWFFALLFTIFSYLSLIMPKWLVKQLKTD